MAMPGSYAITRFKNETPRIYQAVSFNHRAKFFHGADIQTGQQFRIRLSEVIAWHETLEAALSALIQLKLTITAEDAAIRRAQQDLTDAQRRRDRNLAKAAAGQLQKA